MAPDGPPSDRRRGSRFQPLALLTVALVVALVLAILFATFLIVPLAVLAAVYVGFVAIDRLRRHRDGDDEQSAG